MCILEPLKNQSESWRIPEKGYEPCLHLPLSTQVYKWVPADLVLEVTLQ